MKNRWRQEVAIGRQHPRAALRVVKLRPERALLERLQDAEEVSVRKMPARRDGARVRRERGACEEVPERKTCVRREREQRRERAEESQVIKDDGARSRGV